MKAYLIDPVTRTVTEVEYSGDYQQIYKLIDCDTFTCVDLNEHADTVFVDDEGLVNGKCTEFFLLRNYHQPLAGKGLVLGTNDEGDSVSPSITLDQLKAQVDWVPSIFQMMRIAS